MNAEPFFPESYAFAESWLLAKPLAIREFKASWEAVLYRVHGKIFGLLFRDKMNRLILNLKCDPYLCLHYRAEYPQVGPGYHMNKLHWNSVYLEADPLPDSVFRELADISFRLVCAGLPRKIQKEIG